MHTMTVEWFLVSVGKGLQMCTPSQITDDSHHSEWQQSHKYQRCCDLSVY